MNLTEGLNRFDKVYFINLEHRTDRLKHITNELAKTNIDTNKIKRINGYYIKTFGTLGCVKSHIKVLEDFLKTPENIKNCIIFEDDFEFTKDIEEINNLINMIFENNINFDVLMLSCNILHSCETKYNFLRKIIDGQTLSGYCINKNFAPILLKNYNESLIMLENIGHSIHNFCCDIWMKKLQPKSNWYAINPLVGKQMESYSDIENKIVCYNC